MPVETFFSRPVRLDMWQNIVGVGWDPEKKKDIIAVCSFEFSSSDYDFGQYASPPFSSGTAPTIQVVAARLIKLPIRRDWVGWVESGGPSSGETLKLADPAGGFDVFDSGGFPSIVKECYTGVFIHKGVGPAGAASTPPAPKKYFCSMIINVGEIAKHLKENILPPDEGAKFFEKTEAEHTGTDFRNEILIQFADYWPSSEQGFIYPFGTVPSPMTQVPVKIHYRAWIGGELRFNATSGEIVNDGGKPVEASGTAGTGHGTADEESASIGNVQPHEDLKPLNVLLRINPATGVALFETTTYPP